MLHKHLIGFAIVGSVFLTVPASPAPAPGQAGGPPIKPSVRFSDTTIEFAIPDAMPRETGMKVTILGPDDEVLLREMVASSFFTWSPTGGLPEADYRYEVRPILPTAEGLKGSHMQQAEPRVRFRAGSFHWSNGSLTDLTGGTNAWTEEESEAGLEGPSQEADLVASSAAPEIAFDDTTTSDPDFRIFTNADSSNRFFNVAHGGVNVIALRTDAAVDTTDSVTVNATGDVGLADDTLFVDRSAGSVGVGTTVPTQELHVVSPDGGDIRLSGSAQGEEWDLGINSANGSLNINDTTTAGNAVTIEMGTPEQTLRLNSAGRVGIGTPSPSAKLHVAGSGRIDGDVALGSSRTLKTSFGTVDSAEVLARVADLPLASWRYKAEEEDKRHIGPFAEDFQRLFGLGDGETISVIDAQGVTLAAIQGLQQRLAEKDAEIAALTARLTAVEAHLDATRQRQASRRGGSVLAGPMPVSVQSIARIEGADGRQPRR